MVTPTEKGFVFSALPKSTKEAASKFSLKRIKTIAKTALQSYIDSYFNSERHVNRKMLEASAGRIQYFTDLTFSSSTNDPKIERPIQLARMYTNLKEHFPAILIIDAGATPRQYISSRVPDIRTATFVTPLEYVVPLTVAVASLDEETTDILSSLISLVFGPFLLLGGGTELHGNVDNNDRWTVKLPNVYQWSALTPSNIEGDSKDQIWSCTFDLEITVEDILEVSIQNFMEVNPTPVAVTGKGLCDILPIISFPATLKINQQETIKVELLRLNHRIVLDKPQLATFDPETYVLTPKLPGFLKIMILDKSNQIIKQHIVELIF